MSAVPLHPRHRTDAQFARVIWMTPVTVNDPQMREFMVRRLIALECRRRRVIPHDHNVAKRIALTALRAGSSAAAALQAARRYLQAVAPSSPSPASRTSR